MACTEWGTYRFSLAVQATSMEDGITFYGDSLTVRVYHISIDLFVSHTCGSLPQIQQQERRNTNCGRRRMARPEVLQTSHANSKAYVNIRRVRWVTS